MIPEDNRRRTMALHLTGPALRFFETSRFLQPARQVNAVVRRLSDGHCSVNIVNEESTIHEKLSAQQR
jgi:hypothetical protein